MAVVQLRSPTEGRAYYDRKKAAGKAPMEAMRCLKRRLSDVVYRQLLADAIRSTKTGPGGHSGATLDSSAVDSNPDIDASKKSLPGPASHHATRANSPRPARSSTRSRRPATAPAIDRREQPLVDIEGSQMCAGVTMSQGRTRLARSPIRITTTMITIQVMAAPTISTGSAGADRASIKTTETTA